MAKRITKKEQYINGLNHDLDYLRGELKAAKEQGKFRIWHHGDTFTRYQVHQQIQELESELLAVESDPTYKPWK